MGKKQKVFVETKDTALQLAESIADSQEDKVLAKKKLNNERRVNLARTPRPRSSDNGRLGKAKEAIISQRTKAKKEKARTRKAVASGQEGNPATTPPAQAKKKGVSFA